jgi:hypothetical protein
MGAFSCAWISFGRRSGWLSGGVLPQADNSNKKQPRIARCPQADLHEKLPANCTGEHAAALLWVLFNN